MNVLRTVLTLILSMSLAYFLLDIKIKHRKSLYRLGLFVAVVLIINGFVLLNFGYKFFLKLYPLLVHIPSYIAFLFISKHKGIKLFFVLLTVFVLSMVPVSVGVVISSFFNLNLIILNGVCFVMYLPTGFIFYKYFRPSFLYMLRNTTKGWLGFCAIPLTYLAIIYTNGMYNVNNLKNKSAVMFMLLSLILTLTAYILILRFFKQTREQLSLQSEKNLLQMQVATAQAHLGALEESQEKTIIYRHDMRHHLNLIRAYLADNNVAAAEKYIINIENILESAVVEKYCSNYSVNLILCSYIAKAKNEQIKVETRINLPETTAVSDMELCVIFANAIENAINACVLVPIIDSRYLKILCKNENDKLFIQVINSYEGSILFDGDMPVSLTEDHGLGTKSIAAVAEKYGGIYSFTAENSAFKASIIL